MKLSLIVALLAVAACSSSENDAAPTTTPDASSPPLDAAAPDAASDGAADSGVEGGLDLDLCSDEGWCQTILGTSNDQLSGVWGDGTGVVWAIGNGPSGASQEIAGKIFRWDGSAWSLSAVFRNTTLTGIWGSSPTDIYIAATLSLQMYDANGEFETPGQILRGTGPTSATLSWTPTTVTRSAAGNVKMGNVWGSGADAWVAGTETSMSNPRGFVAHIADAGPNAVTAVTEYFAPAATGTAPARTLTALWGEAPADVWAAGSDVVAGVSTAVVMRRTVSTGGAISWARDATVGTAMSNVLVGISLGTGKAAVGGQRGDPLAPCTTIELTATPSWTKLATTNCEEPDALFGSATALWAAGGGPLREWDGTTWRLARTSPSLHPIAIASAVRAMWGTSADDFWAVGDFSLALHKQKGTSP